MTSPLYMMALTMVPRLNCVNQRLLLDSVESAEALFEHRNDLKALLPDASPLLLENLSRMEELLSRARQELEWAESKHIKCLCFDDAKYPARLRNCPDAPLVLYYRGTVDLNCPHIISMVGTRRCSEYGKDLCREFMEELSRQLPDCLVVSGLAYGIDINAHRQSLQHGLSTVGVLAHGMNQIYPRMHQGTAQKMLSQGGLLTEYMSGTPMDRVNFLARNRIVAGMADATIVVESASKGGSLVTARISNDYGREVFAFPGRVHDETSEGCHKLIRQNQAHLITSAQDVLEALGWETEESRKTRRMQPIQRQLFVELSAEEQRVADRLQGTEGKAMNQLAAETGIPVGRLSSLLMGLEMRGVVRLMNGGMYRLL